MALAHPFCKGYILFHICLSPAREIGLSCTGSGISCLGGCIGHIFVAMSWHSLRSVMTWAARESICSLVVVSLMSMVVIVCTVCCVAAVVVSLPNRYRSITFCGMGSINGG